MPVFQPSSLGRDFPSSPLHVLIPWFHHATACSGRTTVPSPDNADNGCLTSCSCMVRSVGITPASPRCSHGHTRLHVQLSSRWASFQNSSSPILSNGLDPWKVQILGLIPVSSSRLPTISVPTPASFPQLRLDIILVLSCHHSICVASCYLDIS